MNYVSYHPYFERRWRGKGELVDPLEWDVKVYLGLNGAMHDAAIVAWGIKGYYDSSRYAFTLNVYARTTILIFAIRPISAIRYMAEMGQSSDESNQYVPWSAHGLPIVPGLIEPITPLSTCNTCKHKHLKQYVGEMALKAWRGPDYINGTKGYAGVGWIRAKEWWPYQRPNFVTPPFAGYVSGHSTFSRAAADVRNALLLRSCSILTLPYCNIDNNIHDW